MSQIIFNTTVDMQNILGTPSTGFAVAYDLDNVIKQKDSSGVVTPIGGGGGSQSLKQTLSIGNDSGTYSINLGTTSYISTSVGNGRLYLSYGNTYSTYLMNGDLSTATSSVNLTPDFISLSKTSTNQFTNLNLQSNTASTVVGSSTYSTSIRNTKDGISLLVNQLGLGPGFVESVKIGNISDGSDGLVKSYLHLNTNGSTTSNGVYNTVVIGGENILATQSNTVYLGNNVNVNNAYTLPNTDGTVDQVMRTDGVGNLYWSDSSGETPGLYKVLGASAYSGTYSIIMGISQSILSENGNSAIYLDYGQFANTLHLTNNISITQSYIQLSENLLSIGATNGLVTITNGLGLQYTDDYTGTFVTHSLVTKGYVDSLGNGSYETYKIAYVDSQYGANSTAKLGRVDLPYLTFASASQVLSGTYPSGGLIYIKKGLYTEACELLDNTDYYCEPGVIFSQNGFNDGGGAVNCNVYGYSQFNGTDATLVALDVQNSSNINFEFDSINNLQVGFKINSSTGNINVKGRYIKSQADYGSVISIEGGGKFQFEIRDGIIGAYDVIYIKSGFTGTFSATSPSIICDSSLNSSGVVADYGHALNVHESISGYVTINSNLSNISTYIGGNNSAAKIGSGNVIINGNLNGNNEIGLYLTDGLVGNVVVNGDINSNREAIEHLSDLINLKVNNSLIKSMGLGTSTYSIHINGGSQSSTYLYNTTIYNGMTNSSLVYMQGTTSQFGTYNSLAYSVGSSGYFIYGTPSFNVGIHNTRSNKDNFEAVNDIFTPSGFIYDTNLYLPIF